MKNEITRRIQIVNDEVMILVKSEPKQQEITPVDIKRVIWEMQRNLKAALSRRKTFCENMVEKGFIAKEGDTLVCRDGIFNITSYNVMCDLLENWESCIKNVDALNIHQVYQLVKSLPYLSAFIHSELEMIQSYLLWLLDEKKLAVEKQYKIDLEKH
jgi:hypothetical protein